MSFFEKLYEFFYENILTVLFVVFIAKRFLFFKKME